MERDIRTDDCLDWPEIVKAAKRRRREMSLTQRRLAAVAGVSLPTLVHFEAGQDIRLSSALAILKVLEMVAMRVEGTLRILATGDLGAGPYQAMFAPYSGQGGAMEPHKLADRATLEVFLTELRVGKEERQQAFAELARTNSASILPVQLSSVEMRQYWPGQFSSTHA